MIICKLKEAILVEPTLPNIEVIGFNRLALIIRGYTLWELPPNGQGIAAQQMLKMLEHFDIQAMGQLSSDYVHHVVEAKKLAFEDRAKFYADPDFNKIPVRHLISEEYNQARATLISPNKAALSVEPGNPNLDKGDTVLPHHRRC